MTDSGEFDARPVRAFLPGPGAPADQSRWPASVPAMGQLLREGLELPAGLTVLGPRGIRPASWADLEVVIAWRQFMRDPQFFFRHLW